MKIPTYLLLTALLLWGQIFAQGTVTVTGTDLAPTFSPGTSTPIVRLVSSSITLLPTIASVKVDRTGTATNTDVPTAKLYRDLNKNDVVDGSDVQIGGTQTFSGSPASVTFSSLGYSPSTSENLLIVYDVASGANTSNTAGVSMQSGYITGEVGTTVTFGGITTGGQPLPVELVSFTARVLENTFVELSWRTATEANNYGFQIERQAQGSTDWQSIGFLQGYGTSNAPHDYTYVDHPGNSGRLVYRLKQIDRDGLFTYGIQREVSLGIPLNGFALLQNFPNPFNPKTEIVFSVPEKTFVRLLVYNALGQLVTTLADQDMEAGSHHVVLNANNWSSGIYYYRLETPNFVQTKKLLFVK